MSLNVFNWNFRPRYYFTHPWKWISELFKNIRAAWMRVTKGFSSRDVWDFDSWFCSVVPPMLKYLADEGSAYPGKEPFDTPEKWHDWLYEMANRIERLNCDDWIEDNNEYSKEYEKTFEIDSLDKEEIRKKYYERCKELHQVRQQVLEDFGKSWFRYFDYLWD